jgi:hypothetical protein
LPEAVRLPAQDYPVANTKLGNLGFRAAALYLLHGDVQTTARACSDGLGGLLSIVVEPEREEEGIKDCQGAIVSALRLLVVEAGIVEPASGALPEPSTAVAHWRARERKAAME